MEQPAETLTGRELDILKSNEAVVMVNARCSLVMMNDGSAKVGALFLTGNGGDGRECDECDGSEMRRGSFQSIKRCL